MRKNRKISGIYGIVNTVNGKIYVGQSKHINHRFTQHFEKLFNNKHFNRHLQYAYKKYGDIVFRTIILEECELQDLNSREDFFISKYKSFNSKYGYNIRPTSDKHAQITKRIIGIKNKEILINNNILKALNSKKVNQYNLDGAFIKTWNSCKEIKEVFNISIGNINTYLNNFTTTKSLKGFMWKWDDGNKNNLKSKYIKGKKGIALSVFYKNITLQFTKIEEAVNALDISRDTISRGLKDGKVHKGYIFKLI